MSDVVVNVAALRSAAQALVEEGGPITFLENAQAQLHDAYLGSMALTIFGISTANAHDNALAAHDSNLQGGIEHLRDVSSKLNTTADNWEQSDQPWVIK